MAVNPIPAMARDRFDEQVASLTAFWKRTKTAPKHEIQMFRTFNPNRIAVVEYDPMIGESTTIWVELGEGKWGFQINIL